MAKTTLYLVRHGESLGNKLGIILGHADLDLSELGYKQAEMTAEALREVDFCTIYSSDLIRAKNTALCNAKIRNLEVITDENLRELYLGDWENLDKNILVSDYSDLFNGGWRKQYGTFTPPNGESVAGGTERVYRALEQIAKRHEGKTVLVASHAAVIRGFWAKTLGLAPEKWAEETYFPSNASYTIVEYEGEKFIPVSFSNDEHIGALVTNIES